MNHAGVSEGIRTVGYGVNSGLVCMNDLGFYILAAPAQGEIR